MARIKSYKQAYMKEFNVTGEEYDKLYDVYALRARRFEKIHNVKLNKAKEFCPLMQNFLTNSLNKKAIKKALNDVVNLSCLIGYFWILWLLPFAEIGMVGFLSFLYIKSY